MLSAPCAVVIVNGVSRQIEDKMYYWLKDPGCYGVYDINDDSDKVYHVCNGRPSQIKPPKQCFLKFKPYMEYINKTETCFFDYEGPYATEFW